jgi:hypothetical protein
METSSVGIDYSNTIFYKISCKDTSITDLYIGHTTNFVQRKSGHKRGCNNPKCASYHLKLYNVIRQHGGWTNWRMDIIAHHECSDLSDARKREQEYFILYNATLNSIEPYPSPKCANVPTLSVSSFDVKSSHQCDVCHFSCFNTLDVFNLHLTQNRHKKAVSKLERFSTNVADKFDCKLCHYHTSKTSSYNKHLTTAKHIKMTKIDSMYDNSYQCNCGKEYKQRQGLWRHKQVCYTNLHSDLIAEPDTEENLPTALPIPRETNATMFEFMCDRLQDNFDQSQLVNELVKQNSELKSLMIEQNKHMLELMKNVLKDNQIDKNIVCV